MAKDAYISALQEVLNDKTPVGASSRTREQIEADITKVSERLRGPLHNVERLWLVEDRRNLRKELATLEATKA
jgi:hypothetical protein